MKNSAGFCKPLNSSSQSTRVSVSALPAAAVTWACPESWPEFQYGYEVYAGDDEAENIEVLLGLVVAVAVVEVLGIVVSNEVKSVLRTDAGI